LDSDGDGVGDDVDPFPQDPLQWADTDGDGIADSIDDDQFRAGLFYSYFEDDLQTPTSQGQSADIDLTLRQRHNNYRLQFDGFINIPESARYTFDMTTNDASQITIDGNVVLSEPSSRSIGAHNALDLLVGQHPLVLTYVHYSGVPQLAVYLKAPGLAHQKITNFSELNYRYFEGTRAQLADLTQLTPIAQGAIADFDVTVAQRDTDFAIEFTGFVDINKSQHFDFNISTDNQTDSHSTLRLNDNLLLSQPAVDVVNNQFSLDLIKGYHPFSATHTQGAGTALLLLEVQSANTLRQTVPTDWYFNNEYLSTDTDGDGVPDVVDNFPNDPVEYADLDGDGIGDINDPDIDGDGFSNENDAFERDPTEWADLDNDGIGDNSDADRDGDGVLNVDDVFPNDPAESRDMDGDGIGDNADPDRDGDGVSNDADQFPNDPTESTDLDGDGIGDNSDPDRDGDAVANAA
ncbi:MAG: thrombospondin type 3 repeat-containing protein, partial [Psychrosphaera sp.]|nr:thrombospondin type 3 repeat-containing protein [Psychrosphaera sp.]